MSVPWMLLVKLTDDELSELRQEYAAQLRLVAEEQDRRTLARRSSPERLEFTSCLACGARNIVGIACACGE